MNKFQKKYFFLIILFNTLFQLNAQSNIVTSGANFSNGSGSISYSLGQIDYISSSNTSNLINQGLQQPFEIVTLSGNEIKEIQIIVQVYPNPSINNLVILIEDYNYENLSYKLFDIRGRDIIEGKISSSQTIVNMEQYASTTYILKLIENDKEIKTFKILKN